MGNCASDAGMQHVLVTGEDGPYRRYNKSLQRRRMRDDASVDTSFEKIELREQEETNATKQVKASSSSSTILTVQTASETEQSMSLSPSESGLSSSILSSPSSTSMNQEQKQQARPQHVLVRGADYSLGTDKPPLSISTNSPINEEAAASTPSPTWGATPSDASSKPGRALQQRLQKAKYMQMAMSTSSTGEPLAETDHNNTSAVADESFVSPVSIRDHNCDGDENGNPNNLSNDEFEASLQQGMIWAEMEVDGSAVLTLALSETLPTLENPSPSMFLAVGTEAGSLKITELMDHNHGPRLGNSVSLQRQGRIRAVDFLPGDGRHLACGGDDGTCLLVGVHQHKHQSLQILAEIARQDRIYAIKFSPDSTFLAVGGYDETVGIFDVTSLTAPRLVAEIECPGLISTLAWSPDGKFLAMGGSDKVCTVVSQHSGWRLVHEIRRSAPISALEWHPEQGHGNFHLAVGSNDVVIVDQDTFQVQQEIVFGDNTPRCDSSLSSSSVATSNNARVSGLCWSPHHGNYLVVCAHNHGAKLLEAKTFSTIQAIQHSTNINCVVWGEHTVFSPGHGAANQQYLSVGGEDGRVSVVKTGPAELQDDNASTATSSYFSSRSDWILQDNDFYDIEDRRCLNQQGENDVEQPLCDHRGQPDVGDNVPVEPQGRQVFQRHTGQIHTVAFSRGSKSKPSAFFATASVDGFVTIRSMSGMGFGKILCSLEFLDPVGCLSFSHGSRLLACGSNDGTVRVVSTSGWVVAAVIAVETPVVGISFSKNNERLAIVGNDSILTLVDPQADFACVCELEDESTITTVDWSSKHLAVGQEDGTISLYETGKIFENDPSVSATITRSLAVRSLVWGAHSNFLVAGGEDGCLGVYGSGSTGEWTCVHTISVGFEVFNVDWSPSGRHLAVAGGDPDASHQQLKVVDTVFWADIEEFQVALATKQSDGKDEVRDDDGCTEEVSPRRRKKHISALSFSQDGKKLAFQGEDNCTRIVNASAWDVIFTLQPQTDDFSCCDSSDHIPILTTATEDDSEIAK